MADNETRQGDFQSKDCPRDAVNDLQCTVSRAVYLCVCVQLTSGQSGAKNLGKNEHKTLP